MKPGIFALLTVVATLSLIFSSGCLQQDRNVADDSGGSRVLSPGECLARGGRTLNIVGGASCDANETKIGNVTGFISPNICCIPSDEYCSGMTLLEAKSIAEASDCMLNGTLKGTSMCNEYTGTWWLDLDINKSGCAPACVVDVDTREAVINWRCTGLLG